MLNTRFAQRAAARALAALVWLAPAAVAAADPMAEQLYQEGRKAAAAKDWDVACRKFKESHDREPAPGTQEQFGAIVAAWVNTGAECPAEGSKP